MPSIKLTPNRIASLEVPSDRSAINYYDSSLPGFAVRVSRGGSRTYIVRRSGKEHAIGGVKLLTLEQARNKARAFLLARSTGEALPTNVTLREALDDWIDAREDRSSPLTLRVRRNTIEQHLSKWLALPLRAIAPDMVIDRHREITKASGPGAANNTMQSLGAVWSFAQIRDTSLPECPVRALSRAKTWNPRPVRDLELPPDKLPDFFTKLAEVATTPHRELLAVIAFTGMRRGEARALTWADVDEGKGLLRLREAKGKPRTIPLTSPVWRVLKSLPKGEASHLVFPPTRSDGKMLAEEATIKRLDGLITGAHSLRKTYASLAAGLVPYPVVVELLGHSRKGVTLAHYVRVGPDDLASHAEAIAKAIDRGTKILDRKRKR